MFVAFLFVIPQALPAQPKVKFQHFTVEDGLSQDYIFCMIQDSDGFMWFGTEDGLNRFDGAHFKVYRSNPDDPGTLSYSNIRSLYEDRHGNIWAGTLTGVIHRFDRITETFTRFDVDSANVIPQNQKVITALAEDKKGGLWAGTRYSGLFYKKEGSSQFIPVKLPVQGTDNYPQPTVSALLRDTQGALWVATGKGLFQYDSSSRSFIGFSHDPDNPASVSHNMIRALSIGPSGKLWIGTAQGVDYYEPSTKRFYRFSAHLPDACALDSISVSAVLEDRNNTLWVNTSLGLLKFDLHTNCHQKFIHNSFDPQSLSHNTIHGLLLDKEGGVWIGTRNGANRYDAKLHRFKHFHHDPANPRTLPESNVWSFRKDRTRVWWISTNTMQTPYSLEKGVIPEYEMDPVIVEHLIRPQRGFLLEDQRGNVWAVGDGLFVIHRATGAVRSYLPDPDNPGSIGSKDIFRGYECRDGTIWLKTGAGMSVFFPETGTFENYADTLPDGTPFRAHGVTDFFEDAAGNMWLGLRGEGLLLLSDRHARSFKYYKHDPSNPNSLSDDVVHVIAQDHKGRMWISTPSGLNLLTDKEKGVFRRFREKDGLPHDYVFGIGEDAQRRLWMSTLRGIVCFDPEKETFWVYTEEDGIAGNEYNDDSYFIDTKTGEMFFGGDLGFTAFHPDSIPGETFIPPVFITRFQYYVPGKGGLAPVEIKGIGEKKSITLSHREKTLLTVEFAALSFSKPVKTQYMYRLKGYNDEWIHTGNNRNASFTNLAPGTYTLMVKGSNGDGVWNDTPTELSITILPPWYWAWWSKSLYLLLLAGLLYAFYRFQLKRRLAQAETLRLRELDGVKTRLYTNITHEFRTPLTVILGMADKIEEAPRQWLGEGVKTIRRNGRNLLRLVNQMLDLARLEGGALPLTMIQGDINAHLKTMMEMYRSYADVKNIAMEFVAEPEHLVMDYDPDKTGDIVSNLLSNALKFTPAGGKVVVSSLQSAQSEAPHSIPHTAHRMPHTAYCLLLTVQDTGPGIAPEKLPYIFDRFYQADDSATRRGEGTGIGLALTHELVKLLGGSIEAQSEQGQGTTFIVRLPVGHQAPLQEALPALKSVVIEMPAPQPVSPGRTQGELPLALIVEDNADVTRLLMANLKDRYRIETAPNGREGVEKALELLPDVVISDVMMPEMDGFELCRTLKEDLRSSHIPILLLTARADVDSRIEGLEMGADAYLAKPFNQQELEVSLRKSLELRERLRQRYAGGELPPAPAAAGAFRREDAFVQQLRELIAQHYADERFNVEALAKSLAMSETQLRRKTKALLDEMPKDILRAYRLKKSYELLQQGELNVSEVSDATGFKDMAHFSNAFYQAYGKRPSEARGR